MIARSRAGKIKPVYAPIDNSHVTLASEIIDTFQQHVGKKKGELFEALERFEGLGYDYRLIRGLVTLLERKCVFEAESYIDPRIARKTVFTEANKYSLIATEELKKIVLSTAASTLNITTKQLETSLWSDLDQEIKLKEVNYIAPDDLLKQYNMSLTQTLLFRATSIKFQTSENCKRIFRHIKYLGLMYAIEKDEGLFKITVDGPMAMFKLTERYGTSFAKLFSILVEANEWKLNATLISGGRDSPRIVQLELDSVSVGGVIGKSSFEPQQFSAFDSSVEEKFARHFAALGSGWRVKREPEPLVVGRHIMIPDFGFEKDGMKAYLEIVGFWTEDYLSKKIQKLKQVNERNMIIAVDKNLSCSRIKELKMEIIFYEKEIPLKPIIEDLKKIEGIHISKKLETLSLTEFKLQDDSVSLDELAKRLHSSKEVIRLWLQSVPKKGCRLVGDTLFSETKLDEIDKKVNQLGEVKFSVVADLLRDIGVEETYSILETLGYSVKWHGLDQEKAVISKRKT